MGKQVRPSIIALLASVLLVLSAVVGIVAALPDGSTSFDETTASDEEFAFPEKLVSPQTRSILSYARDMPNYGYNVGTAATYNVTCKLSLDSDLESDALKSDALMDSLSPGVRTRYKGWLLDDEAEYTAFIDERLRRLNEDRPSRK